MGAETLIQVGQVGIGLAFIWLIDRWARALVLELKRMNGLNIQAAMRLERIERIQEKILEVLSDGKADREAEAQRA